MNWVQLNVLKRPPPPDIGTHQYLDFGDTSYLAANVCFCGYEFEKEHLLERQELFATINFHGTSVPYYWQIIWC
jgi:hypothetical protein